MKASNYGELLESLENWMSWENPDAYDIGGMMGVLDACLRNLGRYGVEGELDEVANFLEPDAVLVLLDLADRARANPANH